MPYIPPEIVKNAEEMDLLTYFQNYDNKNYLKKLEMELIL